MTWCLWKIRFINRALKKLKNSDEFNGEYFEESKSDNGKKEELGTKKKQEEKVQKDIEGKEQALNNEIEEKLKKYKDFGYLKSNRKREEDQDNFDNDKAEKLTDSEIRYKKKCVS